MRRLNGLFLALLLGACTPQIQTIGPVTHQARLAPTAIITPDGAHLPVTIWPAVGQTKAVVVALHGFTDYRNAFALPAPTWQQAGITTLAFDQRGFGGTERAGIWGGLAAYRADPSACVKGPWVDPGFAADWFQSASAVKDPPRVRRTTLSSLWLGPLAMLFHPAELYSCYGLAIRRDSGAATTLCVGYADDFVGYVTDAAAYTNGEYAAVTVPKLLDLPPFTTETGRLLAAAATALLAVRS